MDSEWIIGALAFITIGGILGLSIFHFGFQLRSAANREAAKGIAADRESAATGSAEDRDHRSLRQRLDEAPGINDRLSDRATGLPLLSVLFDTKWSEVRSVLKDKSSRRAAHAADSSLMG